MTASNAGFSPSGIADGEAYTHGENGIVQLVEPAARVSNASIPIGNATSIAEVYVLPAGC